MDPFEVLVAEPPQFPDDYVYGLLADRWGIRGSIRSLLSERDQNFRVTDTGGTEYVLKIANPCEERRVTDFQVKALRHIERRDPSLRVPRVHLTVDGEDGFEVREDGKVYFVRLVSYLAGRPFEDVAISNAYRFNLGAHLAALGIALRDFEHPGSSHALLWDMTHALELRSLLRHIADPDVKREVSTVLDVYASDIEPQLAELRSQVIHNDLNPANALVDTADPDTVAGIIDFGDMVHSPLVFDVAVAAAYHRAFGQQPLELLCHFVRGYHSVCPLEQRELEILFHLLKTRLSMTVAILHWRASRKGPDDPYLGAALEGESNAASFLMHLRNVSPGHALETFKRTCFPAR
jgi:Ser/Thr protein kinase RdoA (MazF antagonist)